MTTPRDALAIALDEVDRAVERCLSLATAGAMAPDERQAAADRTVRAYELADTKAEAILSAIIAAGGCPGLAATVEAACDRASARVAAAWGQGAKQQAVARHAYQRAAERAQRVTEAIVLPYWRRRVEVSDAA